MTREGSRISSQPEVEYEERDLVIPPLLIAALVFFAAWFVLGTYVVTHPHIQERFTRSLPMNEAQQLLFLRRMELLSIPFQPGIVSLAGVVMVWVAFLRTEWSDRLLFSAATILSSTVILGGTEAIFHEISGHWYGSTMVCAGAITYSLCWRMAHAARHTLFAVLSIIGVVVAIGLPYYETFASVLDVAGALLFAAAIWCSSLYISQRAGVEPFG